MVIALKEKNKIYIKIAIVGETDLERGNKTKQNKNSRKEREKKCHNYFFIIYNIRNLK